MIHKTNSKNKTGQRKYSFFIHYNKPASLAAGKNILTIHYRGICHQVEDFVCSAVIRPRSRKTQPRCVLAGKGTVTVTGKFARIE